MPLLEFSIYNSSQLLYFLGFFLMGKTNKQAIACNTKAVGSVRKSLVSSSNNSPFLLGNLRQIIYSSQASLFSVKIVI